MIEVDFLPVGKETRSGDAIIVRYRVGTSDRLVIVDGGFTDTAADILDHLETWLGTTEIDLVVSTHPDDDHIRGLIGLVETAERVGEVWVHRPSLHGFAGSSEHKADLAEELVAAGRGRGAVVREPFAGMQFDDCLTVAGPSKADYELWLGDEATPATKALLARQVSQTQLHVDLAQRYGAQLSDPGETLDSGDDTTPRNQHSVILNILVEGQRLVLTGDAGMAGLSAAADNLDSWQLNTPPPWVFQVPHHGSRRNVSPEVLDRFLGQPGYFSDGRTRDAIASVAAKAVDHPRGAVANAITRRGYKVFATRGRTLNCSSGYPRRSGWSEAPVIGWLSEDL